jgi:hypothetical protein
MVFWGCRSKGDNVFVVDLAFWYLTLFALLTLVCSILFVVYLCIRKTFEMLFAGSLAGLQQVLMPPAHAHMRVEFAAAAVDNRAGALLRGAGTAAAAALPCPWGPIRADISPEIAQKIERVMTIGIGMCDADGNPYPHPIAPRVALAIVEALHGRE